MGRDMALGEDDRLADIDARRDIGGGDLARRPRKGGRILRQGDRMQVDDAEDRLALRLQPDPVLERPQIISKVQLVGRLHAGKDADHRLLDSVSGGRGVIRRAPALGQGRFALALHHPGDVAELCRAGEHDRPGIDGQPASDQQGDPGAAPDQVGRPPAGQRILDRRQRRRHCDGGADHPGQCMPQSGIEAQQTAPLEAPGQHGDIDPGGDAGRGRNADDAEMEDQDEGQGQDGIQRHRDQAEFQRRPGVLAGVIGGRECLRQDIGGMPAE